MRSLPRICAAIVSILLLMPFPTFGVPLTTVGPVDSQDSDGLHPIVSDDDTVGNSPANEADEESVRLLLDLALFDGFGLSATAETAMLRETEQIFASIGVDVNWLDRAEDPSTPGAAPVEVKVILSSSLPASWNLKERALGVVLGPQWDTVFIFPRRVAWALGLGDRADRRALVARNPQVGQALGRVIVHEVIHAIAPAHLHAEVGIMRGHQNRHSLIVEEARLDGRCATAFRQGIGSLRP